MSRSRPRQSIRSSSAVARGAVVTRQQPIRFSPSKVASTVWLLPTSTVSSTAAPRRAVRSPDRYAEVTALLVGSAGHRGRRIPAQLDDTVVAVHVHHARD